SVCKVQHKDNLLVNAKNCLREDTCEIGTRVSYDCVGDYEVSVRSDDAALSRSNSYLTPVVTDGNYYETVSPYECVD
ncbi:hypothetical protein MAR_038518, partial [Mya arenaria]